MKSTIYMGMYKALVTVGGTNKIIYQRTFLFI